MMYACYLTDVIAITVVTCISNLVQHHFMRKNETMMIYFGIQKTNTNKVLSQADIIPTKSIKVIPHQWHKHAQQ